MLKRWSVIFKAFGNINRLKIVQSLSHGEKKMVSALAEELDISLKSTSKHLIILKSLDILDAVGKDGHVYYSLNPNTSPDARKAIKLFVH